YVQRLRRLPPALRRAHRGVVAVGKTMNAPAPTLAQIRRALAPHAPEKSLETFRPAAVLVPLLPRPEGLHVLFTERSKELRSHAGQISFPGGGIDDQDVDARAAALREAREEVGLDPRHVEIIGQLDDCPTFVTGYVILPVVRSEERRVGKEGRWGCGEVQYDE